MKNTYAINGVEFGLHFKMQHSIPQKNYIKSMKNVLIFVKMHQFSWKILNKFPKCINFHEKYDVFDTFFEYLWCKPNFIFSILERILFTILEYLWWKIEAKNDDFRSRSLLVAGWLAGWLATGFTVLIVKVIRAYTTYTLPYIH